METIVLIRSTPKPNAANLRPMMLNMDLILIGQLVLEQFMFEIVNAWTDERLLLRWAKNGPK